MFVSGKAMFIHVHRLNLSPTQQKGKGKELNID